MIDYKLLEALAMVIEEGGFEKAAQRLHLTQSAVSQRIKMIEESMGQILVTRTIPPLPTEAGLTLLAHYRKVRLLEDDLTPEILHTSAPRLTTLAVGVNADSLATWFLDAAADIAAKYNFIFDIRVDDQEQTHKLLQNGHVCGCISTYPKQLHGCRVEPLGSFEYGLFCTPYFMEKWFFSGFGWDTIQAAPTIRFNRQDNLNALFFRRLFGTEPRSIPTFYVPSSEKFVDCILRNLCYGTIPALQSGPLSERGLLVDLAPACKIDIDLYFHCWNLKSKTLETFTGEFVAAARQLLLASRQQAE